MSGRIDALTAQVADVVLIPVTLFTEADLVSAGFVIAKVIAILVRTDTLDQRLAEVAGMVVIFILAQLRHACQADVAIVDILIFAICAKLGQIFPADIAAVIVVFISTLADAALAEIAPVVAVFIKQDTQTYSISAYTSSSGMVKVTMEPITLYSGWALFSS